ncbi:MAG: hypothetical protein KatS3mg007_1752 [Thermoanaerobaculum sp.]|jgi:RHS repeat-associated protein|nr:MAG: hypothetical protein KatS3mg007_1752 [Thermoanaerobaculum sp.]
MEVRPNGTVITGTYDDQDRLLQYGEVTFTYTANGELVSKCQGSTCQYFDYDVFGNLSHVLLDNGVEIEYVIDGRNRRIGKKINGTSVQGFIYDDQLRIVAELDGSNQIVSRFIYADHINVPEVLEKGGRTYRILHDHLGSPRFVIDTQTGEIVQEMHYDAWGNVVFDSNPGFQPFGFAGGLYDPHTKLVRFGARDYDSQIGRWTSKDPFGISSREPNVYQYALGDPLMNYDPFGDLAAGVGEKRPWYQIPCAKRLAEELRSSVPQQFGNFQWHNNKKDKFFHCYVSCLITKECGKLGAYAAGAGKEILDLLDFKRGTTPSWEDWDADLEGIKCGDESVFCEDCFCCCSRKYPPVG